MPRVPEPLAGRPTLAVRFVWAGDHGDGAQHLAPIRAAAPVLMDAVQTMPYAAIGMVRADPVEPMPAYEDSDLLHDLPAEAVDALLAVAGPDSDSPQVIVELRQLGGALARAPKAPSALCHRDAAFSLVTIGVLAPPVADAVPGHASMVRETLATWATGATLPSFSAGTGAERLARSYDEQTLARLVELAERHDPRHVFRVGQVPVRRRSKELA